MNCKFCVERKFFERAREVENMGKTKPLKSK